MMVPTRRWRQEMIGITLFLGFCAGGWAAEREGGELKVPAQDAAAVQAGKERFSERCAFCHGGGGRGAKGPCLTCGRFRHGGSDESLYNSIASGVPQTQMGAFGTSLSREEILNIIAFLRAETQRRKAAGELE